MTLSIGTRVGVYEVTGTLGAGGMGEVYRARDCTPLQRDVALKVLPEQFALDPDRLARFRREAQVLASLNHPNIAAIYGFEESTPSTGSGQAGVHALVLELVEGPTLADRIAQGPIPLDEALPIAKQIAEALEAAHEHGIIHRDLKPANIKLRPDGAVKVLDFGLAKLHEPNGPNGSNDPNVLSMSPTITSPVMMTGIGTLLGTAAYMSPEQAQGREADKRSDIWAFGCVLYEMLTGNHAFAGDGVAVTLARVLEREPDFDALLPSVPARVRQALRLCLRKDPKQRVRDIRDVQLALDGAFETFISNTTAPRGMRWRLAAAVAAGALIVATVGGAWAWVALRRDPARVQRFTIVPPSAGLTLSAVDRNLAITPDGSALIYVANSGAQVFVRRFDQLEPRAIVTGGARSVLVSPDGQWVGFTEGGSTLKRVAITGGPAETITPTDGAPRGATWGPDGTIVFATASLASGLQRVPAGGGEPTVLTRPDVKRGENDHMWPEFLPGGQAVLYTITPATGDFENARIALLDLRTGTSTVLINGGSDAHYVPTGHLVYGAAGTLYAVAFDLERLVVNGTPAPVLQGVGTTDTGAANIAVANGSLVYAPGIAGGGGRETVMSVDRQGDASPLPGLAPGAYRDVRVSPDGTRLALTLREDIWIYDFSRATLSRLTTEPAWDRGPLWTPDGSRIVYTSYRSGYPEMFWRREDGTGTEERLLTRGNDLIDLRAVSWGAKGTQLLFTAVGAQYETAQIPIARPSDAQVLLTGARRDFAAVSPDGDWMAYHDNTSGRNQVYLERYPLLGNRRPISTDGGVRPTWSRDGRELFFNSVDSRQLLAVAVQSGATLAAGRPQVLFDFTMSAPAGSRPYDVAPDGRFIIIRSGQSEAGTPAPQILVVQNWFEELKRLVPVN